MKVVLLGSGVLPIPPPGWGAVERAIEGLAEGLRSLGNEVIVVNRVWDRRPADEYRFALQLPTLLKGVDRDVLHASTPVVGNSLGMRGMPYVYTSHSRHWSGTRGPTERFGFLLECRACAQAERTIALTADVSLRMARARPPTPARRIRIVPNGIDVARFAPDWAARTGHRLLGVGAIHPRKRWHLAVEALRELPGSTLTLAGPVQNEAYAQQLRGRAPPGSLNFAGEVSASDLAKLYSTHDVLVHPSGSELQSIAVLEAMASALPVVGMAILADELPGPLASQLVPESGSEKEKVQGLRQRLGELLADPDRRRQEGTQLRQHALETYNWSVVAQRVLDVYKEVNAPGSARPRLPRGSRPVLS